jgi:hypothetical protein
MKGMLLSELLFYSRHEQDARASGGLMLKSIKTENGHERNVVE